MGGLLALACAEEPSVEIGTDASLVVDAGDLSDAARPDAAVPDTAEPDAASLPDVALADAATPDTASSPDAARAEAGADAGTSHAFPPPLVLLHLSDIHFGSGSFAVPAFEMAVAEILPAVDPLMTFATGDLVETGNNTESWDDYRQHIDGAGFTHLSYIEVPGNHDIYLDLDLSNYLDSTLAGRNGHGLHGLYHTDTDWGRLRVVALNTVSAGDPLRDSTGYLDSGQVDELIAAMDAEAQPPEYTFVLGHHPAAIDGLSLFNTDDELFRLLGAADATAYLHGHRHMHLLDWEGDVLFAMSRTLGNPGDEGSINRAGFNILTVDDGVAAKGVPLDEANITVDWPVVMITRPANAALGGANPHTAPLPRASDGQLLRAVVFSPVAVADLVQFRVDGGAWQPMARAGQHYEGWFSTPDAEQCVLEVQASVQGDTASDEIEVQLQ